MSNEWYTGIIYRDSPKAQYPTEQNNALYSALSIAKCGKVM